MISYPNPKLPAITIATRAHDDCEVLLWCRAGRAEVTVPGTSVVLGAGEVLWLGRGVEHGVEAEKNTVLMPSFLPPGARSAPGWSVIRDVGPELAALLSVASVDATSSLTVPGSARLALRLRDALADQRTAEPAPAATTTWLKGEQEHVLLWCARGRAVVTTDRELTIGPEQALLIPPGLPHHVRTDPGSVVLPTLVAPSPEDVHATQVRLLNLPTRMRAEAIYLATATESAVRPDDWLEAAPSMLPISDLLAAVPTPLPHLPEGTPAWRVQQMQRALHDEPGHLGTVSDWAGRFGVTTRSVELSFSKHAQMSFSEWRHALRMRRALDWLDDGRQAKWVSRRLGFAHISAFSRAFARHTGGSVRDHQAQAKDEVLRLY